LRDALVRQGADVRTVGPEFGTAIWGMNLEAKRAWRADGGIGTVWADWMPEVVIYSIQPPFEFNERYRGVPHVVYTVDNHVINFRQEGIDHYFLGHLHGEAMPVSGARDTWLPCGYDPVFFTPSAIAWKDREYDVAMIGVMYPQRLELVKAMHGAGLKVIAGIGAVYEEFRNIYHNSRISLCASIRGDVSQRIFETAAMGCLVLSDWSEDFAALGADGIDIFGSGEEAVQKVKGWVARPGEAERMIERSMKWAGPNSWDARAAVILKWVGENG
jgi:hypothetical protein